MLYGIHIRLETPILGSKLNSRSKIMELGARDGKWSVDRDVWRWALHEALDGLNLKSVPDEVFMPDLSMALPTTYTFQREHTDGRGKVAFTAHEAIRGGTRIMLPCVISMPPECDGHLPTEDDVRRVFEYIGRFIGFSPWGRAHGYGRFKVIEVSKLHAAEN